MNRDSKIYIAGHNGMVGSAIQRKLISLGYNNLIVRSSSDLDLKNQQNVQTFFESERPEFVFLAAAKVGGILANNTFRAQFIYDNLMIQNNVIHSAFTVSCQKLLFLGSSCIYPKLAKQPLKEEYLLTGALEYTNEPYAISKIAGIKMCESYENQYGANFKSVMPTNLYGPNDNYDLANSHVLPALIKKFHDAKVSCSSEVIVWGTGSPRREFLHVNDMADACIFVMNEYDGKSFLNIGVGEDISIKELAETIKEIVGYKGKIVFDATKPDGTPRKLLDVTKLKSLGWTAKIGLREGISSVYHENLKSGIL